MIYECAMSTIVALLDKTVKCSLIVEVLRCYQNIIVLFIVVIVHTSYDDGDVLSHCIEFMMTILLFL